MFLIVKLYDAYDGAKDLFTYEKFFENLNVICKTMTQKVLCCIISCKIPEFLARIFCTAQFLARISSWTFIGVVDVRSRCCRDAPKHDGRCTQARRRERFRKRAPASTSMFAVVYSSLVRFLRRHRCERMSCDKHALMPLAIH